MLLGEKRSATRWQVCLSGSVDGVMSSYAHVLLVPVTSTQASPMRSPATYRRLVKPHHARMVAAIRENTKVV